MSLIFEYRFEPVGQGLFAWGCLRNRDDRALRFTWVYDCGTTSQEKYLTAAITRLENHLAARKQIDLLTLSHFDEDHISGVCELIKKFKVGTLMLPYTTLTQRLVFAFDNGVAVNSNLMDFFLAPANYLTDLGGPGIDRILFIPASIPEGPSLAGGNPDGPDDGAGDFPELKFQVDRVAESAELAVNEPAKQTTGSKTSVQTLARGSNLLLPNLWEFVPYNDDPQNVISPDFYVKVEAVEARLLHSTSRRDRHRALNRLKRFYDEEFGNDSVERNAISLFLYSGPIYPSWKQVWLRPFSLMDYNRSVVRARLRPGPQNVEDAGRCSILYAGDGYLNTPHQLNRLVGYLLRERILRVAIFQVMHHGAEDNWHKGVAVTIAPLFSVFSSDPEHRGYKHPHPPVLREFWRYGAVQVDKRQGFWAGGFLDR